MTKQKTLGLVIVDGVGFRNFMLSTFPEEARKRFKHIVIFSGLPRHAYDTIDLNGIIIEELDDFKESGYTWFFRKLKENAHLQRHKKGNFGIQDNLAITYNTQKNRRGRLTRFIFKWASVFNSEFYIGIYNYLQQLSFKNHPSTKKYKLLLRKYQPDILFFTHQRPSYIAPVIYAAEKAKIPTASFIFSWDNLASKGRMAGNFNYFLVWSDLMKQDLLHFYSTIKQETIFVVGMPQFEPYTMDIYKCDRNEFYIKNKLDKNIKTICFSCGDVSTSKNDPVYIETIAKAIKNNVFSEPVNFLVRTSPAESPERFLSTKERYPFIAWNHPRWPLLRPSHSEPWSQRVPESQDVQDLRAILEFCDVGINMCSTMSLDFMVFDKPVINPVFGNTDNSLYDDQRFLKYAHYKPVAESGSVIIATNEKELIEAIRVYLNHPKKNSLERQQMLKLQVGRPLKNTSERIAEQLILCIS
ncbi:hypothetical protein [Ascidiimonas aurantiaca]|uniref:hypothetical protein n=1 Tax=Ascidiimonas aurantiaca TaxID=1685432 RepID=UPI0030EC2DF7